MKEVKLEVGQGARLKNQYQHNIVLLHQQDGYYIGADNQRFGPYFKLFFEKSSKHNDDIFITGYNLDKSTIYRVGIYGIEVADVVDTSVRASKMLNKIIKEEIKIEGCTLLGVERGYSVFLDADNKVFIVNNEEEIKPVEQYEKFDTFKELVKFYRAKGILVYDDEIERLSKDSIFADINGLEDIIKELTIEDLPTSMQGRVKAGYPYDNELYGCNSKFLVDKLKEKGKIKKVKKIFIKNDKTYEQQLNDNGYYIISVNNKISDLIYFSKRHEQEYARVCEAFKRQYYKILSNTEIDENTLKAVKDLLKMDPTRYIGRTLICNYEQFTIETFEIILDKMIREYNDTNGRYTTIRWIFELATAEWLKIVSPEIYSELWKKSEEAFNDYKDAYNNRYGNKP